MSVINQMLKDLEERNSGPQNTQTGYVPVQNKASKKGYIWIVVVLISINIIGWFVWQLYDENQALKEDHASKESYQFENALNNADESKQGQSIAPKNLQSEISLLDSGQDEPLTTRASTVVVDKKNASPAESLAEKPLNKTENSSGETKLVSKKVLKDSKAQDEQKMAEVAQTSERTNQAATIEQNRNKQTAGDVQKSHAVKPSKMSVSRRQLTTGELVDKKLIQAEKAIATNDINRAETLYEDILLLAPEHKHTRKQLAALWFGRQAYQPALNLLSQGISLEPTDSEFRLMQARIYLKNESYSAALNVLKGYQDSPDREYQILLASVAQEVGDFSAAIRAYDVLLQLQPNNGRWWLGSAIAYDSKGDFASAKNAYQKAIGTNDLTKSSADFAVQRLVELGE